MGSWQLADLVFIDARTGGHDAAVDTFERYLSNPGWLSAAALQLDPRHEPLLDHARFRELVSRYWSTRAALHDRTAVIAR